MYCQLSYVLMGSAPQMASAGAGSRNAATRARADRIDFMGILLFRVFEAQRDALYAGSGHGVVASFRSSPTDSILNGARTPALKRSAASRATRILSCGSRVGVECSEPRASWNPHPHAVMPQETSPTW